MVNLTPKQKKFFRTNGWVKTSLGLSIKEISEYQNSALNLVKKAKKTHYPYRRIYNDFLFDFNLAAVECPLNKSVCDPRLYSLFKKIELGKCVNDIMGWKDAACSLIRLFCMENYNYTGHWHFDMINRNKCIQVGIYLKDEQGFRILKKNKEKEVLNLLFEKNEPSYNPSLPYKIFDEYFTSIDAKAGEILFFEPSILHQGVYSTSRLQFHMRLENLATFDLNEITDFDNDNFDFKTLKEYNINVDIKNNILNFPQEKRISILRRFVNSINYFVPILNLTRYLRLKKIHKNKKLSFDFFSNTFYQN